MKNKILTTTAIIIIIIIFNYNKKLNKKFIRFSNSNSSIRISKKFML